MIKICNGTDYILSVGGKPNKYEECDNYEPVCLLSNVDSDCDY